MNEKSSFFKIFILHSLLSKTLIQWKILYLSKKLLSFLSFLLNLKSNFVLFNLI
jgi:hypothetical protein